MSKELEFFVKADLYEGKVASGAKKKFPDKKPIGAKIPKAPLLPSRIDVIGFKRAIFS